MDISLSELSAAVINRAYEDAVTDGPPSAFRSRDDWRKNRQEAVEFLTTDNADLQYWCRIGGHNINAILSGSRKKFQELKLI